MYGRDDRSGRRVYGSALCGKSRRRVHPFAGARRPLDAGRGAGDESFGNGWIEMNFPAERETAVSPPPGLEKALGVAFIYVGIGDLTGYQASSRGGVIRVRPEGENVVIGGQAVTVMEGALR